MCSSVEGQRERDRQTDRQILSNIIKMIAVVAACNGRKVVLGLRNLGKVIRYISQIWRLGDRAS